MKQAKSNISNSFIILPDTTDNGLTRTISGVSHKGLQTEMPVVVERPLTIFLNSTEILTAMTVIDHPKLLALGFLSNQGMIRDLSEIEDVDYDEELQIVVVRTVSETSYEDKLKKRTRTSGCAMGTVFGEIKDLVEEITLPAKEVRTSWLYKLVSIINQTPSLYLKSGAIHGTVLCFRDKPLVYMEDVGRHNAVDKIAGWMLLSNEKGEDKILYTTGRLTSEIVIKTAMMGIPVLASRSGFTDWGVELARQVNLTLIGRLRGQRFTCLSGESNLVYDADISNIPEEDRRHVRKAAQRDQT